MSISQVVRGQQSPLACTTTISSFPYTEDFEANNGNWLPGGTASDWAWGTPAKPVINGAASGTKAWVTGGLTNSSYNNGENSWLESPCFNFTTLLFLKLVLIFSGRRRNNLTAHPSSILLMAAQTGFYWAV